MGISTAFRRIISGSFSSIASPINSSQLTSVRSKHTVTRGHISGYDRPLRQFVSSKGKTAGRNSAGRITIFHRGGGAKRLQRKIDLKRSTSSLGVVERIEYDPNRTSRIAVVRWIEGAEVGCQRKVNMVEEYAPPRKTFEPTSTTIQGQFSFSSLPGMVDQRKLVSSGPKANHVVIGLDNGTTPGLKIPFTSKAAGSKITSAKDVFFSALSSSKAKGDGASYSFVSSLGLPRIAVAGARPAFFAARMREDVKGNESLSLGDIRKWDTDSVVWAHKIKRKAALSWQSLRRQEKLGLLGASEHNKSKPKTDQVKEEDGTYSVDRAPVSYIIATNQMEPGRMVMNCGTPKRSKDDLSRPAQYASRN